MANQKPVSTSNDEESRRPRRPRRMRNSTPKDPDGLRGSLLEKRRRESVLAGNEEESLSTTSSNGPLNSSLLEKQRSRRDGKVANNGEESRRSKDPDGLRGSLLKKQKSRGRGEEADIPRRRHTMVDYSLGDLLGDEAADCPSRSHAADYSLGDRLLASDHRRFRRAKRGESLTPKGRVFVRRADRTFTCAEFEGVDGDGMLRFRVNVAGSFKMLSPEKLSSHALVPTTECDSPAGDAREERLQVDKVITQSRRKSEMCSSRTAETVSVTVSPPPSPVVTKSVDGIHASAPEPEKIHKVGDCVIYQGRGGLALARVQEVHLDDQLSPYYYIRLQDGSERQTDNEHIYLTDPSCFVEGMLKQL